MSQPARVGFASEGVECVGYLHLPQAVRGPLPCVVLCPGFGGTQDVPSIQAVARACVDAGFAALTFDYRGFGESSGARAPPAQRPQGDSGDRRLLAAKYCGSRPDVSQYEQGQG
jgi:dienelactone hydrolase